MANLHSIKDTAAEQRLFITRVIIAVIGILIAVTIVIARLTQLQVVEHDHYAKLSQGNRIRLEAAPPTRGLILDRNGVVLAQNLPAYQLEMIPEQVREIDDTLERLANDNLIDVDDIERLRERISRSPKFRPVTLVDRMSEEAIAVFAPLRPYYPGVDIRARLVRDYPQGELTAHVIGYVSGINSEDLRRVDPTNYAGTNQIGKTGIELAFEALLHGTVGHNEIVTTAEGRAIEASPRDEPVPGQNIYLSIDIELQRLAAEQLDGRRGSVVAISPKTGEVLAMVSAPSFDPNGFASGMNNETFGALQNNLDRPLFNRSIAGRYPPGSTIKPMIAIGALDSQRISASRTIHCEGSFTLPGSTHRYRDWKPEGHGLVDLRDSIMQSCDVYFYELAQEMDIDLMHDYLVGFGLGDKLGIEIPGEKAGLIPSRAWKKSAFSRRADRVWFPGETVNASIGQGYTLVTPLQLAHSVATLAMRGKRLAPQITYQFEDPLSGEKTPSEPQIREAIVIKDEADWDTIISAMNAVMQSPRGTAYATGRTAKYAIAGKSGTAQVFSVAQEDEYDELELDERLKDHALFISFAPIDDPQIAVAVVIENGSSGSSVAAPVARAITDLWMQRINAL